MKLKILIALIVALMLAACGGNAPAATTAPGNNSNNNNNSGGAADPAGAAKAFFDAIFAGNDVASHYCSAMPAEAKTALGGMGAAYTTGGITVDSSGLTYKVDSEEGDNATVLVGGELKTTVGGNTTATPMTEFPVVLKNEGGSWKICG